MPGGGGGINLVSDIKVAPFKVLMGSHPDISTINLPSSIYQGFF